MVSIETTQKQTALSPDSQGRHPDGFLSGNLLKTIAIAAMLIDHIATIFLPQGDPLGTIMHFIGRITGPTMFYFLAEGYHYTRDKNRYTLRLFLFAIVSYFPYIFAFYGMPSLENARHLNVIYTLLICLLLLRVRHEVRPLWLKVLLMAGLFALSVPGDWFYIAPLCVLAFDVFRGDFKRQAFAYCLIMLGFDGLYYPLVYPLQCVLGGQAILWEEMRYFISNFGVFVPIILLYFYNGKKGRGGRGSKWSFYIFYPAHLLILGVLHLFIGG